MSKCNYVYECYDSCNKKCYDVYKCYDTCAKPCCEPCKPKPCCEPCKPKVCYEPCKPKVCYEPCVKTVCCEPCKPKPCNPCEKPCCKPCEKPCCKPCEKPCDPCYKPCDPCKPQPPRCTAVFISSLNGRNEVPPNASVATGTLVGLLSLNEQRFDFVLHTNGLTNITAAHFHEAPAGANGPIVKPIDIDLITGVAVGSWTTTDPTNPLTPALVQKLKQGLIYVNVHTTQLPGGEIRDQLRLTNVPVCNNTNNTNGGYPVTY